MECSCIWVNQDRDIDGAWFEPRTPKALKSHRCCECHRKIKKGESYNCESGVWGGSFMSFKTCSDCLSIRKSFFCDGWIYESMMEYLKEHIGEAGGQISSDCITPLTSRAKDIVFGMIEEVWDRENDWDGFIKERTFE